MAALELLKDLELFHSLLDEDLEFLTTRTEEKIYAAGEPIFKQGGAAINFFVVKSGEVMITRIGEDGKNFDLAKYVSGDSFGEFDFITGALYTVEARALTPATLVIFPAFPHTLDGLSLEKPQTISRLYLRSLCVLAGRLRSTHSLISENTAWVKELQEQTYTDQLTGLHNRLYLDAEIPRLLQLPVSLIVVKPDRFKELNDKYGHQAGDAVLARLGRVLLEVIEDKGEGFAVRLRSNEMALILQKTAMEDALAVARSLAAAIAGIGPSFQSRLASGAPDSPPAAAPGADSGAFRLSASMALTEYKDKNRRWAEHLSLAYGYMLDVWKKGGNKICVLKTFPRGWNQAGKRRYP